MESLSYQKIIIEKALRKHIIKHQKTSENRSNSVKQVRKLIIKNRNSKSSSNNNSLMHSHENYQTIKRIN